MLLSEAIDQYFLACKVNNSSKRTINGYQYNLDNFINVIGDQPIEQITANDIRKFMANEMARTNMRSGEPLSSQTNYKAYSVVRTFFNWLAEQELIEKAPTDRTRPPKVDDDLPEALTKEEIRRIFEYLEIIGSFRDKVIFEFFLDTGCRVAEVADLEMDDIHIHDGWAKVKGKGRKEGIVPLGKKLCMDLNLYITRYRRAPEDQRALFVSSRSPCTGLTRDGISSMVKRVHKAVDIKGKYGPHKLRHTMATQFIANGGDISILRRILRHTSVAVTQRYINLVQGDVQSAHRDYSPLDHLGD
jgi:integrase/recombinase XerD